MNKDKVITLSVGAGGLNTNEFLKDILCRELGISEKQLDTDSYTFDTKDNEKYNFTTDMFVVNPLFFKGGDIGKLAIAGTVNDIITGGAEPLFLSLSAVIEEGFSLESLIKILQSIKKICEKAGVKIVTGDTKVVNKGNCDGCFICTTGIGRQILKNKPHPDRIESGDVIILTGSLGEHSAAIMDSRNEYGIKTGLSSDCAALNKPFTDIFNRGMECKFLRDPTRGGAASVLNELARSSKKCIEIFENDIPVKKEVVGFCEITGFDYLNLANEGKIIVVTDEDSAVNMVKILKQYEVTKNSRIIGKITDRSESTVLLHTRQGGLRILPFPTGQLLPRIC